MFAFKYIRTFKNQKLLLTKKKTNKYKFFVLNDNAFKYNAIFYVKHCQHSPLKFNK